jgi:two-component system NtrC family response regulator
MPAASTIDPYADLNRFFDIMTTSEDLTTSMLSLLENICAKLRMENGFIVQKGTDGNYETISAIEGNSRREWLGESLVQKVLSGSEPIFIQNVVGSAFENNRSLLATGFLSICAWPLRFRSQTLGALVIGSTLPRSHLTEIEHSNARLYTSIASHFLHVFLQEANLRGQMERLERLKANDDQPLLSDNPALLAMSNLARKVAPSGLGVLIQGETGVGKEVLARWIHTKSEASKGPFVALNCGAIPENLLESILFGHKRGAFTGALSDQKGKFQLAHGGTLFLDEIGDMPLNLQVKLLRAIQERRIEPLGSTQSFPFDVRILAASHRRLKELVAEGKFREDLYYRLAEITLEIPPLRERREDIPLLVSYFLEEAGAKKTLSSRTWEWLCVQDWPGNVRELLSATKRAALLANGDKIEVEDYRAGLPAEINSNKRTWLGGKTLKEANDAFLREKVEQALERSQGNRRLAAELLGVTPRTLFRYLEEFGKTKSEPTMTDLSQ